MNHAPASPSVSNADEEVHAYLAARDAGLSRRLAEVYAKAVRTACDLETLPKVAWTPEVSQQYGATIKHIEALDTLMRLPNPRTIKLEPAGRVTA